MGSLLFIGQTLAWKEVRIFPKYSFHRTSYAPLRPNLLGNGWSSEWLKDYNGQTYWLSLDMDQFMRFPKWLNIALGYGAEGMVSANRISNIQNGFDPYRKYFLSIDLDLKAIPTRSKGLKTLAFIVSMIKLPAPTLSFSRKGTVFHPFYF